MKCYRFVELQKTSLSSFKCNIICLLWLESKHSWRLGHIAEHDNYPRNYTLFNTPFQFLQTCLLLFLLVLKGNFQGLAFCSRLGSTEQRIFFLRLNSSLWMLGTVIVQNFFKLLIVDWTIICFSKNGMKVGIIVNRQCNQNHVCCCQGVWWICLFFFLQYSTTKWQLWPDCQEQLLPLSYNKTWGLFAGSKGASSSWSVYDIFLFAGWHLPIILITMPESVFHYQIFFPPVLTFFKWWKFTSNAAQKCTFINVEVGMIVTFQEQYCFAVSE